MNQPAKNLQNTAIDNLRWTLILLSSILLGIWAVKETIALRNILLVTGTLLSIYYISFKFRYEKLKEDLTFWKLIPFILIACIFLWVIGHNFFFSIDPIAQFDELRSTWLRSLLASIVGLGTGLALRNFSNRLNLLWLGIFIAFLVMYCQYIPMALTHNKLLVPNHNSYLFHLKINTALMGMILIVGISGSLFDHLRAVSYRCTYIKSWYLLYWIAGTGIVLWAFVYIVDSRIGIGLSILMYGFWFVFALIFFVGRQLRGSNVKNLLPILFIGLGLSLTFYFGFLQMSVNKGWHSLFEDVKVAVQIESYPNWQNLSKMGYPKREDGQVVTNNTYERVAWATAGAYAIAAYPLGVGTLAYPFTKHPYAPPEIVATPDSTRIATHSGWVELGLAFGIPILGLIFSTLLITFVNAARHAYSMQMTVLGIVSLILSLYFVGEIAIQHGLEILFYLLALTPSLLLTTPKKSAQIIK